MKSCALHDAGTIELFFYDELPAPERASVAEHLAACRQCRTALEELALIRDALAAQPDVASPPAGDWSPFMSRLDQAVGLHGAGAVVVPFERPRALVRRPLIAALATAALLALVAASVFFAFQARQRLGPPDTQTAGIADAVPSDVMPIQAGLASVSARHLERSKLVVLGLANREPAASSESDWAYERELASSLLTDTRLYRMAAERRGLTSMADVMRDLELVLLQTSMAETSDTAALPRIQRLIRRRGLVEKMDAVGTTGMLP